jgi:hypothetical protein
LAFRLLINEVHGMVLKVTHGMQILELSAW